MAFRIQLQVAISSRCGGDMDIMLIVYLGCPGMVVATRTNVDHHLLTSTRAYFPAEWEDLDVLG